MKFAADIAFLSLALGAAAERPTAVERDAPTVVERDLATISNVLSGVNEKIRALDSAVTAFTGQDATALTTASTDLLNTISAGTTTVQGTTELSLQDAISLQTFVQGLQGDAQTLVNDLAAKKPEIQQANLCSIVLQQSQDQATASKSLIDAVVAKVPQAAQAIASQLAGGFSATLQQSTAAFAEGNCTNASGGSGGGAGTTGGAPTATGGTTTARPTGTNSTTTRSSGGSSSTGGAQPTQVTAAAVLNTVGAPVGALAALMAALML